MTNWPPPLFSIWNWFDAQDSFIRAIVDEPRQHTKHDGESALDIRDHKLIAGSELFQSCAISLN